MRRPFSIVGGVALVTVIAGVAVAASASAGTVTYEAEASANTITGTAQAVECRRCSEGSRVTGLGGTGSLTVAGVLAENDGPTKLTVSYWTPDARTAQVVVNGGPPTAFDFPAIRTSRPGTLRITVSLQAGQNAVTFGNPDGPAPDIDKLVLTTDGTPPAPVPPVIVPSSVPAQDPSSAPVAVPSAPVPPPSSGAASPGATSATSATSGAIPDGQQSGSAAADARSAGSSDIETEVVKAVNKERVKAGCTKLTSDDRLVGAARAHSADMAARGYDSHTTPEGVEFGTRITAAGYPWSAAGENIARGQRNPKEVMAGWLGSAAHRANIVNCDFKHIGVGVAADATGALLWTQDFATPR